MNVQEIARCLRTADPYEKCRLTRALGPYTIDAIDADAAHLAPYILPD